MKLIIDTNIIISACVYPDSRIGKLFFSGKYQWYAPRAILAELKKHRKKLESWGARKNDVRQAIRLVHVVDEREIPRELARKAYVLMRDIDESDTPFLELSWYLNCKIWTGDKKFHDGLQRKGIRRTLLTRDLR